MRNKTALMTFILLALSIAGYPFNSHGMKSSARDFAGLQEKSQVGDAKPGTTGHKAPPPASARTNNDCGCVLRSSPIKPIECNDTNFIVDCDAGLDTGCTFRGGGPLIFTIKVDRFVGDVPKLLDAGLISPTATLLMPAFDVDFNGGGSGFNGERDRVTFNGHVVPEEFLNGLDNQWVMNTFTVPIEWVIFPSDPGPGGTAKPADNVIQIDIDTANTEEVWCTSIDWAALTIQVARPAVMVHGILSDGKTWDRPQPNNPCLPFPSDPPNLFSWVNELNQSGLPNSNRLNLGCLNSIQSNASQIAMEVADARQRWGVDKVNLICHSKGGIDARHFVEDDDSVEQVIQLGTPNLGSPLADFIQAGSIIAFGLGNTIRLNQLAGPAGIQLTTPYMFGYNLFHDRNENVSYTSLAGDYDQDCSFFNPFCRGIDSFFLLLTGRGDTIVPVRSVHALDYTQNLTFNSSGENKSATHGILTGSRDVFNAVKGRVEAKARQGAGQPATQPSHTSTVVGTISQGQTQTRTINIDQLTPTIFSLMYPSGNLDLALISPSGQRFDPVTIKGNPNVSRDESAILGGMLEVYTFNSPEVGAWTVEVSAPTVVDPSGSVTYAVTGWPQNPAITLSASAERSSIHANETLRLFGTLKNNGAPVIGATVTATFLLPNNTSQSLSLHDDGANGDATAGDGIYTGDFTNTSQSGNYRIAVTANRPASGGAPAFSREAFLLATVSRSTSTFTGVFREFGLDTDGDQLFNSLVVEADLNITQAASYRVFGILADSQGNTHVAGAQAALTPGTRTVSLRFAGEEIFQNRVDGPYQLVTVRLAEENDTDILPVDEYTESFQTAAYSFRQFQHSPLSLTGGGTSTGVDTNGNGLFDFLNVAIDIEVVNSGFYNWTAQLTDRNGKSIGFASNAGFLSSGFNTLQLAFNGTQIGLNGVDGPYFVTGLIVFGAGGSLVAPNAFTTSPFLANQFEGNCQITCPANITAPNDQALCGANVNYPPPTTTSSCLMVTCNPPSGTFFPVGTTTVNCSSNSGVGCSFTVSVRDVELPVITCPPGITAVTALPGNTSTVVNFPQIVAGDNCSGVTITCAPPSGSSFPVGTSTVTCAATDAAGNNKTCAFPVTVFDARLQDDTGAGRVILFATSGPQKGLYRFCCSGLQFTGTGTVTKQGSTYVLQHNPADRRVLATFDSTQGTASLQSPPGTRICTIQDRDMRNNSSICP